jgi:carbonic anhydrase
MEKNTITADEALDLLMEGNKRFVNDELQHPHLDSARRKMLSEGQAPHTVVLACSDSRMVPEVIFDQGLGDLFVIRVAGNVAKDKVLGSIEYAIEHLGSKLIFVLSHESCGAVTAALGAEEAPGHIGSILEEIKPAVYIARQQRGDLLENAIKNNALITRERIQDSQPIIHQAIAEKGVKVISGYYHLSDGRVEICKYNRSNSPAAC